MQIAVCDDEKEVREMIADKARKLCTGADFTFYEAGEELLQAEKQPDILFLDIQMPGKDGMETARELRKFNKRTVLIFVTAIEEYVFQAFDVGAFHYLVKPFTDEKFIEVLQLAIEQYQKIDNFLQAQTPKKEERNIVVKSGSISTKVLCSDIIYAEVYSRKIIIHSTNGDVEYYGKMSDLEKQLGEDFFRSHRAYIVHFKYVLKYNASVIYFEKGTALMAKKNYPEFVKRFMKFSQRSRNNPYEM